MKIVNLTQQMPTKEQLESGVVYLHEPDQSRMIELITFNTIADTDYAAMHKRAVELADIVRKQGACQAMIGGAPFFMPVLVAVLNAYRIDALFAFSERVSEDIPLEDGSIKKTSVFKHIGFVVG